MKLAPFIPPWAGMLLLSTALVACSGLPIAPPPDPTPATPTAAVPGTPRTWADLVGTTSVPLGWTVRPCDDPTLLCVKAGQNLVGTVELITYPVAEIPFQKDAAGSNTQALKGWVAEHYDSIKRDRAQADPRLIFLAKPAAEVPIGRLSGLRYGFTIRYGNATLAERTIGYVATDGTTLYLFVTGLTNGDPSGAFSSDAALREFEPHLAEIIAGLSL
jgi:hypothetical protein